jgi:hypothetical protein
MRRNHRGSAGSGCHHPTRAGETPEAAKQRVFTGLRRGLFFENRTNKMRHPTCASFFEGRTASIFTASVLLSILQSESRRAGQYRPDGSIIVTQHAVGESHTGVSARTIFGCLCRMSKTLLNFCLLGDRLVALRKVPSNRPQRKVGRPRSPAQQFQPLRWAGTAVPHRTLRLRRSPSRWSD